MRNVIYFYEIFLFKLTFLFFINLTYRQSDRSIEEDE
jgi:hypothetical protein